jgi:hypothetical protein
MKMQRDHGDLKRFYPINDSFGCFIGYTSIDNSKIVNLVEYNFIDKILRKIE